MSYNKILLGVTLVVFCCFTLTHSIKCWTCDSVNSCKNDRNLDCTAALANTTRNYLDIHHKGVNLNSSNPNTFSCLYEHLKVSTGEYLYKGCIDVNIRACSLELRDHYTQSKYTRNCKVCNNKDGCNKNPAGRIDTNALTIGAAILVATLTKSLWSRN